jgi:hypothetical protein
VPAEWRQAGGGARATSMVARWPINRSVRWSVDERAGWHRAASFDWRGVLLRATHGWRQSGGLLAADGCDGHGGRLRCQGAVGVVGAR